MNEEEAVDHVLGLGLHLNALVGAELISWYQENPDRPLDIRDGPHGKQLHARVVFESGEVIGEYTGAVVSDEVAEALPDSFDKIVRIGEDENVVGDVLPETEEFNAVCYANDPGYKVRPDARNIKDWVEQRHTNAKLMMDEGRLVVVAKTRIVPGAEILINYGYGYWVDSPDGMFYPTPLQRWEAWRGMPPSQRRDFPEPYGGVKQAKELTRGLWKAKGSKK